MLGRLPPPKCIFRTEDCNFFSFNYLNEHRKLPDALAPIQSIPTARLTRQFGRPISLYIPLHKKA
jgi:hypothetical protein